MRIAILATGSRGDVEPYVALAAGLSRAGHTVRLVTHETYRALVEAQGIALWPMAGDVREVAQSAEMRALLGKGNLIAILSMMGREAQRAAVGMAQAGLSACQGMDAVVAGIGGVYVAAALAEKLDLRVVQAYYLPFTPTRAYPSAVAPPLPKWAGAVLNRPSYHVTRQMMWQMFRAADGVARRDVFGLPPAPFWGPYRSARLVDSPILYGYSPAVLAPPADWGDNTHVTGYWFLDAAECWTPPPALLAFLQAGPAPVFVGFGSMASRDPVATGKLVLEALSRAGQRGIVQTGWGGLSAERLPETVYALDAAPYAWLFPRMAAIVHHGGAGTTGAGLRAGVPNVVVPFFGDQPFWGRRVAELGVGPAPISQKRLTVDGLAGAIRRATEDGAMLARAAALGATIRAEDGVARAVALIERYAATPRAG